MSIGDYVRTKDGDIGIIINCPEKLKKNYGNWLWFETSYEQRPIRKENIIKSSPQIIDLIEVGDYVNGYYVEDITHNSEEFVLRVVTGSNYFQNPSLYNEDIKTILTHEQMEAMQYRVEE